MPQYITPTLNFKTNAHTSASTPGPSSFNLALTIADQLSVDLMECQLIETVASSGSGALTPANHRLLDGSAAGGATLTPGTVGCFIYLKNNSTTTNENIFISILASSVQAYTDSATGAVAANGSDTPVAPVGPDADTTGLMETNNKTLRTMTLKPGEFAWFPFDYAGDIYHEAATGTPQLEYWRFDRGA